MTSKYDFFKFFEIHIEQAKDSFNILIFQKFQQNNKWIRINFSRISAVKELHVDYKSQITPKAPYLRADIFQIAKKVWFKFIQKQIFINFMQFYELNILQI